jgi:hypothetical protein
LWGQGVREREEKRRRYEATERNSERVA